MLAALRKVGMPLTHIVLARCSEIDPAGLRELVGMPLTQLDLLGVGRLAVEGASLAGLKGRPLRELCLEGCKWLTGSGVEQLKGLPLTDLSLARCDKIRNGDLIHLQVNMYANPRHLRV